MCVCGWCGATSEIFGSLSDSLSCPGRAHRVWTLILSAEVWCSGQERGCNVSEYLLHSKTVALVDRVPFLATFYFNV